MASMKMNKRGIFFTLLAIVIVSIFIISLTFFSGNLTRESSQERVKSLDSFVLSVEEDLPRQIFTNGYRTIFLLEDRIIDSGSYQTNLQNVFQESFFNGTIYGVSEELLEETTFSDLQETLRERGSRVNANLSLSNAALRVDQIDPWNVRFNLTLNLYVYDIAELASWNRSVEIISLVPIQSFSDPIYLVNTNGLVANKFVKTPYATFVSGSDYSNLISHLENSYYISSSSAPSFLNRLQGNFSADVNGVESLVDLTDLTEQGISVSQKSVVDYVYFSASNPSSCIVSGSGLPSWFRIDNAHFGIYSVSC